MIPMDTALITSLTINSPDIAALLLPDRRTVHLHGPRATRSYRVAETCGYLYPYETRRTVKRIQPWPVSGAAKPGIPAALDRADHLRGRDEDAGYDRPVAYLRPDAFAGCARPDRPLQVYSTNSVLSCWRRCSRCERPAQGSAHQPDCPRRRCGHPGVSDPDRSHLRFEHLWHKRAERGGAGV